MSDSLARESVDVRSDTCHSCVTPPVAMQMRDNTGQTAADVAHKQGKSDFLGRLQLAMQQPRAPSRHIQTPSWHMQAMPPIWQHA